MGCSSLFSVAVAASSFLPRPPNKPDPEPKVVAGLAAAPPKREPEPAGVSDFLESSFLSSGLMLAKPAKVEEGLIRPPKTFFFSSPFSAGVLSLADFSAGFSARKPRREGLGCSLGGLSVLGSSSFLGWLKSPPSEDPNNLGLLSSGLVGIVEPNFCVLNKSPPPKLNPLGG